MALPTVITDLNVTAASNSPAGTDTVSTTTGPDEYFRALSAIVKREQSKGADIASATATNIGATSDGTYAHITGTTALAAAQFGTVAAGIERTFVFDGALVLTYNATSFILPTAASITTAANDIGVFRSEGSGNWRCVSYIKASGYQPLDTDLTAIAGGNISQAWPIGSVFIAVVATNPATLLGGGTWAAFGAGRVMVGLDATQTEFDTVEETGGAKTHTLTTAEMPAHTHTENTWQYSGGALASFSPTLNEGLIVTNNSGSTGGGGAHNNLQPYIVCYFWKRTA